MSSVPPLFTVSSELLEKPAALLERRTPALTVTAPAKVFAPLSRIVPVPLLVSPPLVIGTTTSKSTSEAPPPTLKTRVPPFRLTDPLPEIVAVEFDNGLMFESPVNEIWADDKRLIALNVSVPELPASVKTLLESTCSVLMLRLPLPLRLTAPENCADTLMVSPGPLINQLGFCGESHRA